MASRREQFLAGERPDDVAFFLAEGYVDDPDALADHGERVEGGVLLVVPGEQGREAFRAAAGLDVMAFTREAMDREGRVTGSLAGGECPDAGDDGEHRPLFVFAFAEARNPEVGGLYAEGDVVHAYARCACGTSYADRWVAGERAAD